MIDKSFLAFLLGGLGMAITAYRFNRRTYRLAKNVEAAAKVHNKTFSFWNDRSIRFAFVLAPSSLIDVSDTGTLLVAKQALLAHRKTLWKAIVFGAGSMILGLLLAVAVAVCFG